MKGEQPVDLEKYVKIHIQIPDEFSETRDEFTKLFLGYADYLRGKVKEKSVQIYVASLCKIISSRQPSVGDFLGSLPWLIDDSSRGGSKYDKKDHGNTVAALKHMYRYHTKDQFPQWIQIIRSSGWRSFASSHSDHVTFELQNNQVLAPKKMKMSYVDYQYLRDLISSNLSFLSPSNNTLSSIHGPFGYFCYCIGQSQYDIDNRYEARECLSLFHSDNPKDQKHIAIINDNFEKLIRKYR